MGVQVSLLALYIFIKMINSIKLSFAYTRWGKLSENDRQLVIKSSFGRIFHASYIRRNKFSHWSIVTLDS